MPIVLVEPAARAIFARMGKLAEGFPLSAVPYVVRPTQCRCHPETCCCPSYEIALGEEVVARGGNHQALLTLADAANQLRRAVAVTEEEE
jgi:hypothetical protein